MKYLKKGETTLTVTDIYPFRYDYGKGKTVLRIKCAASVPFADIQSFFAETADYDYYDGEDGAETLKTIYTQYGADLDVHYKKTSGSANADGTVTASETYYDIEVLRDPSIEATVLSLQASNAALTQQVTQLTADNAALAARADAAESELTATQLALTEQYESNLAMDSELTSTQSELTATQLAITELYESMLLLGEDEDRTMEEDASTAEGTGSEDNAAANVSASDNTTNPVPAEEPDTEPAGEEV